MDRKFYVFFALFLMLIRANCFAQNSDPKISALQGEWACIKMQSEDYVFDLTEAPFTGMFEMIWKFEGNNFSGLSRDLQNGTSDSLTGTFTVAGGSIIMSSNETSETVSYTVKGNILTMTIDDVILTFRRR